MELIIGHHRPVGQEATPPGPRMDGQRAVLRCPKEFV